MSRFEVQVEHIPVVKLYKIDYYTMQRKLTAAWDWQRIDLEDLYFFHPAWEDWDKIFQFVQRKLPKYLPDQFDCDNFSMYVSVMVAHYFKSNVCARVEGEADFQDDKGPQRHKWNVFFDGDAFYQLESQRYTPPAMIADLSDPYYVPLEIEMG